MPAADIPVWHITLFGSLQAADPAGVRPPITRFRTQRTAALLAFLAFYKGLHSREVLAEMLWPGVAPQTGRTRLKQEIATLRRPLESGLTPGSVLHAEGHSHLGFVGGAISSDAAQFDALLRQADTPGLLPQEVDALLREAARLHGDAGLLPGRYEAWVSDERERLLLLYANALQRIAAVSTPTVSREAWDAAHRAVQAAPFDEASHAALIRLHLADGNVSDARAQFAQWEKLADEAGEDAPSNDLRRLVDNAAVASFAPSAPVLIPAAPTVSAVNTSSGAPIIAPARLPSLLTPFFDREPQIRAVHDALCVPPFARLITLTGPGGMGKTRLSLEVAHLCAAQQSPFHTAPPVVGFAPLAGVSDAAFLWDAVLSAVFPQDEAESAALVGASAKKRLVSLLTSCQPANNGRVLLVLDNLEQIAENAAPLIRDFLHDAPFVSCLVTSRQHLHIGGEREVPVPPLPLLASPIQEGGTFSDGETSPPKVPTASGLWFADRARAARPDFSLNSRNNALVEEICTLLDGIPLALELAAARVAVLGLAPLRDALQSNKLNTLQSRRRDLPVRHRTLRDTIAWSFHLLPKNAQALLLRLSVFRRGWTIGAAQAVSGLDSEAETLALLETLHDHNLIISEPHEGTGETRFLMLETLRQWADEQLSGTERTEAFERLVGFFLQVTAVADLEIRGERERYWLSRLDAEHDNLRAALVWAIQDAQNQARPPSDPLADAALRLCDEIAQYWWLKGHLSEGRAWYKQAINASPDHAVPREALSDALRSCASLAHNQDDNDEARELTLRALHIAQTIRHRRCEAYAYGTLGGIALNCGQFQTACEHFERGLSLFTLYAPKPGYIQNMEAIQQHNLGMARLFLTDHEGARTCFEATMAYWRSKGMVHRSQIADSLEALAHLEWLQNNQNAALPLLQEALAIRREMKVKGGLSHVLLMLSRVHQNENPKKAHEFLRESFQLACETGHRRGMVEALEEIAANQAAQHQDKAASVLSGMASALRLQVPSLSWYGISHPLK